MPRPSARKTKSKAKQSQRRQLHGPLHPWRICPIGEHWVRPYEGTSKLGKPYQNPGSCRRNPTRKDQLYRAEIENIANEFFPGPTGPPGSDTLGFNKPTANGSAYDSAIRGWTKYWNEVLQPDVPLDPNLVKALIATESGFDPTADTKVKGSGRARGLMQLTDGTRKILQDEKGELAEHLLTLTDDDSYDPNLNVAAGVRWLFHKRYLASKKYKRDIDWVEAALEYKDMLRKPRNAHERKKFPEVRQKIVELLKTLSGEE